MHLISIFREVLLFHSHIPMKVNGHKKKRNRDRQIIQLNSRFVIIHVALLTSHSSSRSTRYYTVLSFDSHDKRTRKLPRLYKWDAFHIPTTDRPNCGCTYRKCKCPTINMFLPIHNPQYYDHSFVTHRIIILLFVSVIGICFCFFK